jgi:hypothetical protein
VKQTAKSILAIITQTKTGDPIQETNIVWKEPPSSENAALAGLEEKLEQFVSDYGSHYVQAIEYGYKIAVFGKYESLDSTEVQKFSAAFKATFTAGSAGGGVSTENRDTLSNSKVELRAVVTAGDIQPPHSATLYGYDEIMKFLVAVRAGDIKIYRGPVAFIAKSYRHTLVNYPVTRALFDENTGDAARAPFGVPRGTMIAWAPPTSSFIPLPGGTFKLVPPNGWVLCDGSSNTPDLVNKFVMGTADVAAIRSAGGADTHSHPATSEIWHPSTSFALSVGGFGSGVSVGPRELGGYDGGTFMPAAAPVQPKVNVGPGSSLPPYVKLTYIMKL